MEPKIQPEIVPPTWNPTEILEQVDEAFCALDREWRVTYVNRKAEAILGRSRSQLLGSMVREKFSEADTSQAAAKIAEVMATGTPAAFEYLSPTLNRQITARVYPHEQGVAIFFNDVTAQRHAELTQRWLGAIVASSSDAVIGATPDRIIVSWNQAATQLFGYSAEEMVGQSLKRLVTPELEPEQNGIFEQIRRGEAIVNYETKRLRKDGANLDVSLTISPIFDQQHRVWGVAETVRDVSARKRALTRLVESHAHLNEILETINDAYYAVDGNWRMTYVNHKAEEFWGKRREEMLGKIIWEVFPQAVGTPMYNNLHHAMEKRSRTDFEIEAANMHPDHWFEINAYPNEEGLIVYFRDITERKQTDMALLSERQRYKTLFDSIDEGFCVAEILLDGNGAPIDYRFLEVNGAFEEQSGLTNAIGKTARELVPNLEAVFYETVGEAALSRRPIRFVSGSDAMQRWFSVYAFPIGEAERHRVGILFTDISAQKLAQDTLRLREAQLELITETTPVMLTRCDRDLRYLYVNRAYAELFGHTPEETVGRTMPEVKGAATFETLRPYVERVLQGETVEYETYVPDKRGELRLLHGTYMPERDASGEVSGWIASISDLTERQTTLQALETSQEKYHRMFQAMNEGVQQLQVIYDENDRAIDFVYLDMNPAWEKLLGSTRMERLGHRASEYYQEIPFLDIFGQVALTGVPTYFETFQPYIKKYVQIHAFSMEPRTVTAIFSDITERKQAEEDLRHSRDELEGRVEERTRELGELGANRQQLLQQLVNTQEEERKRIARELHDQLGQLLTAQSIGLKALHGQNPNNPKLDEAIEKLEAMTRSTSETVQSLAYELRPSALDDLGLVAMLANYLDSWGEAHNIQVHFETSGMRDAEMSNEVETAIYRIVQEALTNILKHARAEHAAVVIECSKEVVKAIIEDDGKGFDPDIAHHSGQRRPSLGLTSMRERAEMVGGKMEIESQPNAGTTVFVTIPLGKGESV